MSITAFLPFIGIFAFVIILGVVASKLYTKTSSERAFVRTGLGGQKVVLNGGALVLPIFQEIVWINRNTLRLPVEREKHASLITADKLRVDVAAEFYVRVASTAEAVATAAQTLGNRTMNPAELKQLVEAKFVGALRAAAMEMTMEQLNGQRAEFVAKVKGAVSADLSEMGLELESVSLTSFNQTSKEFFDPNNAIDAEGLLKLTQEIQTRNKARNDIEVETSVQIETRNLEGNKRKLELKREGETARLNTERDIAAATADTQATIAQTAAEGRRRAEQAALEANQKIATTRVETEKNVETATINKNTAVKLRHQETEIDIANKSKDVASAEAQANQARAEAVRSQEQVETARRVEIAEREKKVTLVKAAERAGEDATAVTVAAEAEATAAKHRATAARTEAEGQRDADKLRGEGVKALGEGEAEALRLKNEAQNTLSPELIALEVKKVLIHALPEIIAQSVKPLEAIESIRIAEVGGLGGNANGGGAAGAEAGGSGGGLTGEVVNSALRYRAAQPVVDGLLREVGLSGGGDLNKMLGSAATLAGMAALNNVPAPTATPEASAPEAA